MREFFQGWRRKVGCVTLVMALAVLAIWMRSRLICDQFAYPHNDYQWDIFSADGCLSAFAARLDPLEEGYAAWWSGENHRDDPSAPQLSLIVYKIRPAAWVLPYWMSVLPLTLLAAYLLLWKPRQPTKPADPGMDFSRRHKGTERDKNNSINNPDLPSVPP